jgi:hypothetical protein
MKVVWKCTGGAKIDFTHVCSVVLIVTLKKSLSVLSLLYDPVTPEASADRQGLKAMLLAILLQRRKQTFVLCPAKIKIFPGPQ